jgi:ribosome-associated toxin RatA of RatAB toxin-antitoxin module
MNKPANADRGPEGPRRSPAHFRSRFPLFFFLALFGPWTWGQGDPIAVTIVRGEGGLLLDSVFYAHSTRSNAWEVLTDFERLSNFVSSIARSSARIVSNNRLLLDQEARWRVLIFGGRSRVLLDTVLTPMSEIEFIDLKRVDFSSYEGRWLIDEVNDRVRVHYHLKVRMHSAFLNSAAPGLLKETAAKFLGEVCGEIQRRGAVRGGGLVTRKDSPPASEFR